EPPSLERVDEPWILMRRRAVVVAGEVHVERDAPGVVREQRGGIAADEPRHEAAVEGLDQMAEPFGSELLHRAPELRHNPAVTGHASEERDVRRHEMRPLPRGV